MKLVLKKTEDEKLIKLVKVDGGIRVMIDGKMIAGFYNDGVFVFWGQMASPQFEGRWDE